MKNIFFDLRGHALRVLVADGETISYKQSFERFTLDVAGSADKVLSEISANTGMKLDKVHCIMPSEDVTVSTLVIPAMSLPDAKKVIRRRLIKDTGVQSPLFNAIPMGMRGDKQSYLVESIKRETLERYVGFFRSRKISLKTISTALPSNLRALKKLDRDPSATIALLDIGNDLIEMTMLSDHVISYGKSAILHLDVEKELQSGKTPERIQKMRVYRIVEAVYNAQSDYKKDHPDDPIRKIWVCGTGGSLEGVHEALTESMNIETNSLNIVKEALSDGLHYTALLGLALGLLDGTAVNYLPREMTRRMPVFASNRAAVIVAACAYGLLLVVAAGVIEVKHHTAKTVLTDRMQAAEQTSLDPGATRLYAKNSAYLKSLIARQIAWSPLFGYLAENTPDGMYIEGLSLKSQTNGQMLEILFVTPAHSEVGVKKFLTRIISMIDQCSLLRRTGEPAITITKQDTNKLLHFKVTCEVLSGEN
jgi:hypothetical protein